MPGGTHFWLEPQLRSRCSRDGVRCSTDIWAFGCIVFFVYTGVGPWRGKRIFGSADMEMFGATIFDLWRDRLSLNAKLTDFGLARRVAVDKMSGGTPRWLEPRLRARRRGSVACSSDIWAFGGIAFFVCTGLGPWKGNSIRGSSAMETFGAKIFDHWRSEADEDTRLAASNKEYPHLLSTPDDVGFLGEMCYRCMAQDASMRPTAGDVNLEVRRWPITKRPCQDRGIMSSSDFSVEESRSQSLQLNEHIATVSTTTQLPFARHDTDLPLDIFNDVKDVLCKQLERLRRLPGLNSHREAASSVIHMLLAAVLLEYRSHTTSISL